MKTVIKTKLDKSYKDQLNKIAMLFSDIEHNLYVCLKKTTNPINKVATEYQEKYNIHWDFFNSINRHLQQRINVRKANIKLEVQTLTNQLKSLKKTKPKTKLQEHNNKRKIHNLEQRLIKLKKKEPNIIFGGKKQWKKQFNLEANGYSNHEEWKQDWQNQRSNQFSLVGASKHRKGNNLCQHENNQLQLRIPYCLEKELGKHLILQNVRFSHGQDLLEEAIVNKQPIFYRFISKNDQWYVHVTIDLPNYKRISSSDNGIVGYDLNKREIGWAYLNKEGNLKEHGTIPINLDSKSSEQAKQILSNAEKELIEVCKKYNCPIAYENLDFKKKKAKLIKGINKKYNRMLSSFAYNKSRELLERKAYKVGIQPKPINPAYTSIIGCTKFMKMYGLNSAVAAAISIGRRAMRHSEKIPTVYTFLLPEDNGKHVWSYWNLLTRRYLKFVRRHEYFQIKDTNSVAEVILPRVNKTQGKKLLELLSNASVCAST